jgi:flavodoxin
MKTAVVYYTRDGNTRVTAQALAQKLGADLFELEEVKKRGKSAGAFMAAGFGASVGLCSRLKNDFAPEMKAYDMICIGSPVWAGKTVPAINAFIRGMDAAGKQIILFTVQADEHPEAKPAKCLEAHKVSLEKKGATVTRMLRLHGAPPGKTAEQEDIQRQIKSIYSE